MSVCQGAAEALDSYLQQMGVNEMGTRHWLVLSITR